MFGQLSSFRPNLGASFVLGAIVLAASLVLGGGTRSGFLGDVVLQLIAIPVLLIVVARWLPYTEGAAGRWSFRTALAICLLLVALPALQLIPLPPAIWSQMAGRDIVGAAYAFIDRELPWMPLSMTPRATWLALLSFIPVVAVFLATVQADYRSRRALSLMVIAFACFSVFYGMLQVAQGPASPLRLFAITNPSESVGLFANRNHYAALLYCSLLLMTPWAAAASADLAATSRHRRYPTAVVVAAIFSFTIIIMLLSAQIMARSRAGLALAILAIVAALLLPMTLLRRRDEGSGTGRILVLAVILAVVFMGQYALDRVLERFDTDTLADARIPYARNTIEAAQAHMPFGSGVGSFVSIYGSFEKPADTHRTFANRAHNDILEAWLETGAVGIALFAAFIVWFLACALALLRAHVQSDERIDALLARSAMIAIVLLLVHSLADYPLRTGAMAATFAFCCALLIPPPPGADNTAGQAAVVSPRKRGRSRTSSRRRSATSPLLRTSTPGAPYYPTSGANASGAPAPHVASDPSTVQPPHPPCSTPAEIARPSTFGQTINPAEPSEPARVQGRGVKWQHEGSWPEEWQSAQQQPKAGDSVPVPPRKPDKGG